VKVWWSERARSQVREIFEFITQDRPSAAERILEGFLQRADLITEFPDQGAAWGDPRRSDLRSIIFEGYRLVYRVGTDEIAILSVRDTRMQQTEGEV
jgi:plasmid stabilization system protein ParE